MGTKSAQRQFLVSVSGIPGYFASKTGGGVTSEANKVWNGGSNTPDVISGPPEVENITVTRPWEVADADLLASFRRGVGRITATLTVTPTTPDMVANGLPTIYPNALLVGYKEPEPDASSSDAAQVELEFAAPSVR